ARAYPRSFDGAENSFIVFSMTRQVSLFLYYEHRAKSNRQVLRTNITCQPNLIRLQEDMSGKGLGTAVHHHPEEEEPENWWEFCPVCGCNLLNHKCRFVCSNPQCHFFMSCSEFDR